MSELRGWLVGATVVVCCLASIAQGQQPQIVATHSGKEFRPGEIIVKYNADRVRVCPIHAARSVSRGVAVKDVIPESLERINSRHKLRLEGARKAFAFVAATGDLQRDRVLARQTFELNRSRSARVRGEAAGNFVDLSSVYVVPCQIGHEQAAVAELNLDPAVLYAEVNRYCYTDALPADTYVDPDQDGMWSIGAAWYHSGSDLWGLELTSAEHAWERTTRGDGVVVAVVDSGLDYNHEDVPAVWTNQAEAYGVLGVDDDANGYVDDIHGYDFYNDAAEVMDEYGHGTHCAGTIAAPINGAGVVGVVPEATIMPLKALNHNGAGYSSSLAAAVVYAANNGASVISNSWGGIGSSPIVSEAFAYAHELGCICVASAGNEGWDVVNKYPANIDTVFAVSAIGYDQEKAWFSGWGSRIDVAAPGVEVLSLRATGTDFYGDGKHIVPYRDPLGQYYLANGTSMACPHVAGEAAMILSEKPSVDVEDVRRLIRYKTLDLGDPGFDPYFGAGLINLGAIADFLVDCNENGLLDAEEIRAEPALDCNLNAIPDECDLASGLSQDCNDNGQPDECDVSSGNSNDCNDNLVPDECIADEGDCNANGLPDDCDIAEGTSLDGNNDGVPDECQSILWTPSDEYPTIQSAIDSANDGDVVIVHDGIHTGEGNTDLHISNKTITLRSQNGPEVCILDCQGSGRGISITNASEPESSPLVDGFTIRNGYLSDDEGWGGGIFCEYSSPTITNCVIENNSAGGGGGIYCEYSNPTITDCRVSENEARFARFGEWSGGGILCLIGAATVDQCTITNNRVLSSGSGVGGIGCLGGPSLIRNCLVSGNSAPGWFGGGMRCRGGDEQRVTVESCIVINNSAFRAAGIRCEESVTIESCLIMDNYVSSEDGMGGGIWCGSHTSEPQGYAGRRIEITDCTIYANDGGGYGGGIVCNLTSPTIERCLISENFATQGGGVYVVGELFATYGGPTPVLRRCTLDSNTAMYAGSAASIPGAYGGGICCYWSSPVLEFCEILRNEVTGPPEQWSNRNGGGLAGLGPCRLKIVNCLIAGNRAEQGVGGGLYFESQTSPEIRSVPEITLSTISGNRALEGGGICCRHQIDTQLDNTIVAGNVAAIGSQLSMRIGDPSATLEYCNLPREGEGVSILGNAALHWNDGNISLNPRFVNPTAMDYKLAGESPCIDLGDPDIIVEPGMTDIDGVERLFFDHIDIGAYEAQEFSDCNLNQISDGADISTGTSTDCNANGMPDECDLSEGTSQDCNNNERPDECELMDGDCNTNGVPDACDISFGTSLDVTGNGTPDECEPDCNSNGTADSNDIQAGLSDDCNSNEVPDECESQSDCDGNSVLDICDIASSTGTDCNDNGRLDICELMENDCNQNGILDACDIDAGTSIDCNVNGLPDECDISRQISRDCTLNGLPDECESDCNTNGVADSCDIAAGTSIDADGDAVPDECINVLLVPWQYETIQEAIDAAADDDRVTVSSGVYSGEGNIDLDFKGKLIRLIGQPDAKSCIIDCLGAGRGAHFHNGETSETVMRNFTIRGGSSKTGGALLCEQASPTIEDCVIESCSAERGGGIHCFRSHPTLWNTAFTNNNATEGLSLGGAVYCEYWSYPSFIRCEFSGNRAYSGGAIANNLSGPTLLHTILALNEAAENGGAIFNDMRSRPTIADCVLMLNRADSTGGAISTVGPSFTDVRGSTFTQNQSRNGGAIFTGQYATSELINSVLWGDAAIDGVELAADHNAKLTISYTLVGGGLEAVSMTPASQMEWGSGNLAVDPAFRDVDGPDDSVTRWRDNDLRLTSGSPCVDVGSNGAVVEDFADLDLDGDTEETTPFDYDGNARVTDGNNDGQARLDLGAFELVWHVAGDLDGDDDVDFDDYALFLAAYGHSTNAPGFNPACDYDGDGVITLVDYQRWMAAYREYVGDPLAAPPAAPTPDPSGYDIEVMTDCINGPSTRPSDPRCLELFDFDGDADVDLRDFAAIQSRAAPQ